MIRSATALVLVVAMAGAAGASEMGEESACAGGENRGELSMQVGYLTSSIASGRLSGTELAEDLRKRADAYLKLGEYARAIADYERVIGLTPDRPSDYYHRGLAFEEMDRRDRAEDDYRKARALDPADERFAKRLRQLEEQR